MRYIARRADAARACSRVNVLLILLSMPYIFLLPGFVASVLHEGPDKLGMLLSVTGAGSLVGALVIAALPPKRRGLLFLLSSLFQGVMLIVFSWSTVVLGHRAGDGADGHRAGRAAVVQQRARAGVHATTSTAAA